MDRASAPPGLPPPGFAPTVGPEPACEALPVVRVGVEVEKLPEGAGITVVVVYVVTPGMVVVKVVVISGGGVNVVVTVVMLGALVGVGRVGPVAWFRLRTATMLETGSAWYATAHACSSIA